MFPSNTSFWKLFLGLVVGLAGCADSFIHTHADEKAQPQPKILTAEPTTRVPEIDKGAQELLGKMLDSNPPESIPLTLRGVVAPKGWDPGTTIRVFVNKDAAKTNTSPKDMHFVHSFSLSPLNPNEPKNYQMDLAPALLRLKEKGEWKPGMEIRVTFVLIPDDDQAIPDDVKLPYAALVISVPKSR